MARLKRIGLRPLPPFHTDFAYQEKRYTSGGAGVYRPARSVSVAKFPIPWISIAFSFLANILIKDIGQKFLKLDKSLLFGKIGITLIKI